MKFDLEYFMQKHLQDVCWELGLALNPTLNPSPKFHLKKVLNVGVKW